MSEPENFLERWSRRKQQASVEPAQAPAAKAEKDEASAAVPADTGRAQRAKTGRLRYRRVCRRSNSIGADTDVRGFLQPGVPPELTRAALRRAWSSDPAIRDFVGLVENGWDFNDPNAMHGFGPITPEEVARLLTQSVTLTEPPAAPQPAQVAAIDDKSAGESAPPVGERCGPAVAPAPAQSATSDGTGRSATWWRR